MNANFDFPGFGPEDDSSDDNQKLVRREAKKDKVFELDPKKVEAAQKKGVANKEKLLAKLGDNADLGMLRRDEQVDIHLAVPVKPEPTTLAKVLKTATVVVAPTSQLSVNPAPTVVSKFDYTEKAYGELLKDKQVKHVMHELQEIRKELDKGGKGHVTYEPAKVQKAERLMAQHGFGHLPGLSPGATSTAQGPARTEVTYIDAGDVERLIDSHDYEDALNELAAVLDDME